MKASTSCARSLLLHTVHNAYIASRIKDCVTDEKAILSTSQYLSTYDS